MKYFSFIISALFLSVSCTSQKQSALNVTAAKPIQTGADQTGEYLSYLKDKRVAVMANPTTIIGKRHLVLIGADGRSRRQVDRVE
ncbi:MAG: hypothetical protein EOO02_24430, partial [Chitinophagaceae bacterium]